MLEDLIAQGSRRARECRNLGIQGSERFLVLFGFGSQSNLLGFKCSDLMIQYGELTNEVKGYSPKTAPAEATPTVKPTAPAPNGTPPWKR